ncbi:MAG: YbdD/YjiX family protein [Myxococcaceae bacterium]
MKKIKTLWRWSAQAARLMVGVPDYDNYVEHQKLHHPGQPIMTHVEFFRERQNARYACEKGRFKGCC